MKCNVCGKETGAKWKELCAEHFKEWKNDANPDTFYVLPRLTQEWLREQSDEFLLKEFAGAMPRHFFDDLQEETERFGRKILDERGLEE